MHYLTSILILILLLLIMYYSIEGMKVNMYDWRQPVFDEKATADGLEVERKDSYPGAYSSVPVMDVTPINLEDVNEMFETNVNSNNYSAILDKLNNIEDELLLAKSKYTCTNITGLDVDNPNDNEEFECPEGQILTVGMLSRKCSSRGCTSEECCTERPDDNEIRYYYRNNKCLEVASSEIGLGYYGGNGQPLTEAKEECEQKHTRCSNLDNVTDGIEGEPANLCIEEGAEFDSTKICNATDFTGIDLEDAGQRTASDCYQKCCNID